MPALSPERFRVCLTPDHRRDLLYHARIVHPKECCGMLLGVEEQYCFRILRTLPVRNSACVRDREFAIAPDVVGRGARLARAFGGELLGFYHSHPSGPAYPSQRDVDEASAFPGTLHVIVGLEAKQAIRAWVTDRTKWTPVALYEGG